MSWLAGVRQRLRELLRPSRVEAELDEELRDHFARELEQQQHAIESAAAARRQAHLRVDRPMWREKPSLTVAPGRSFERRCVMSVSPLAAFDAIQGWRQRLCCRSHWASEGPRRSSVWSMPVLLRPLAYPGSDQLYEVRVWWTTFSANLSPADFSPFANRAS